ncbi:MAG: serine/threonine-protein phosphatase [Desulfomonile tiedjei]|uniref:Serine/threonine-protein phosphatase n=1 Tax=Desulfomonile tiedjei TaxID=2358 RepID=A0A9D6Z1E2_9BACT|nr:serine/threonine-protein phosphatase [Desulfomonile tiedjei]
MAKGGNVIVESWARTDTGRQRATNEDCLYIDPDQELVLVLDGMGGHRAGEVASRMAMETIASFYKRYSNASDEKLDIFDDYDNTFTFQANLLRQATFIANRVVLEKSIQSEEYVGMGSTMTGMAIHDYTVSMINVGDTRMYLIRNGTIEQISKDHTLAEDQVERGVMSRDEARESQLRHILSSVIGVDPRIRIHMDELAIFPGDTFVLCTDGVTAVMQDQEILEEILNGSPGPETLERIIDRVNERGGPDNTTLALTVFHEDPEGEKEMVPIVELDASDPSVVHDVKQQEDVEDIDV